MTPLFAGTDTEPANIAMDADPLLSKSPAKPAHFRIRHIT
jgi:hypothetical protein